MPLTAPRQVVPSYGTMIESVLSVALPERMMWHEVRPGPVAFPSASHLIAVGELRLPCATPVNFRSPGQLALNDPFIPDEVCSETFHLKSVQVLGVGMSVEDVQLPSSELLPAIEGSESELLCSSPLHPAATAAANDNTTRKVLFINRNPLKRESQSRSVSGNHALVIGRNCP